MLRKFVLGSLIAISCVGAASATPSRFTFTDPAFGGNPLASSYWLSMVENQKQIQEKNSGIGGTGTTSLADSFKAQLQSRLLAALAAQITGQIYGSDAPTEGKYVIGDLTVQYVTIGDNIKITINDGTTETVIVLPKATDVSSVIN